MDTGQEVAPLILHHSALRPVCLCKLTVWAKWGFTIIYLLCRLKMVLQYGPRFSSCYIKIWLLLITIWMTSPVTLWVKMRPPITSVIFRVYSFFWFLLEHILKADLSFVFFSTLKYFNYFNILLYFFFLFVHSQHFPSRLDTGLLLLSGQTLVGFFNSPYISKWIFIYLQEICFSCPHEDSTFTHTHTHTLGFLMNDFCIIFFVLLLYSSHTNNQSRFNNSPSLCSWCRYPLPAGGGCLSSTPQLVVMVWLCLNFSWKSEPASC